MSLNTVLKIGKALRQTKNNFKYYKYLKPYLIQKDKDGNSIYPICFTIPVKDDFTFDWNKISLTAENDKSDLYYLNFATSDSDSSPKKFGFGDINYTRKSEMDKDGKVKGIKDFGNFTFEKGDLKNAYLNGEKTFKQIKNEYLENSIHSLAQDFKDNKLLTLFTKQLLKGYNEDKEIILSEKLKEYNNKILPIISHLKILENKIELFRFQDSYKSDISKFTDLLLHAPSFEYILQNEQNKIEDYLKNKEDLKKIQIKINLQKHFTKVKKLFAQNEKQDNLSDETLNKIYQYADFNVFIHFDFNGQHWYQFKESFALITNKLNSELSDNTIMGIVPSKSIYRTLCSGNDKNDIQFPQFDIEKRYKSFAFKNSNEFEDFLYTDSFAKKSIRKLLGTDIEFYVFPTEINEDNLIKGEDYIDFFFTTKNEASLNADPIFPPYLGSNSKINRFDFIFSDSSGNTTNDLIEISGLDKSSLRHTQIRIESIAAEIYEERKNEFRTTKELSPLKIEFSFRNILGSAQADSKTGKTTFKANPKYQSHLLKTLPSIFTGGYFEDLILLPAFIQNVEYSIRAGDEKFSFLKFDLKFLLKIQNSKNDKFMEIKNSESYQIGVKLGKLSKPLKKAINPFEKTYVGLLSRRISTKDDCIKFYNEINEKLIMHQKTWGQSSAEIASELASLPNSKYDKEKLAFGFFEGYFKYEAIDKKKDFFLRLEKLLADYEGNQELEIELELLNNTFQEIKN